MLKDALVGSVFKVTELRTQSQLVTGQTAARLALGKPGDKAVQPTTGADFQPGRQMQLYRGCIPLLYEKERASDWMKDVGSLGSLLVCKAVGAVVESPSITF